MKTELIQGSIDLNIIGTDSHRAPPVSFLIASFYHASVGGGNVNRKTEKDLYTIMVKVPVEYQEARQRLMIARAIVTKPKSAFV